MSEDVVTIYCCGTNFGRDRKADEAVAHTWDKTTSRKLILDGPGSPTAKTPIKNGIDNPEIPRILRTENLMKALEAGKGRKKGLGKDGLPQIPKKGANALMDDKFQSYRSYSTKKDGTVKNSWEGSISGIGWADNVILAINWLWEQFYVGKGSNHKSFSTINLAGWSRGAVTCIMLAHAIQEAGFKIKNPNMKVNIFAFDPVPGSKHDFSITPRTNFDATGRTGSRKTLPEIVGEYNSILMEDETSILFKCISPREFSGGVQGYIEYPLPGSHSDCVMFNRYNNHSGVIASHLCHAFLERNGTELSTTKVLSNEKLLEEYSAIRMALLNQGIVERNVAKVRKNLIKNVKRKDVYFINGHHYELFTKTCASIWNAITSNSPLNPLQETWLNVKMPITKNALYYSGLL